MPEYGDPLDRLIHELAHVLRHENEPEDLRLTWFKKKVFEEALARIGPGCEEDLAAAVREAFSKIDQGDIQFIEENFQRLCDRCGECCRETSITLTREKARVAAARLNLSLEEFVSIYGIIPGEENGMLVLPCHPHCPFLKDGKCLIDEKRQEVCGTYPAERLYHAVNLEWLDPDRFDFRCTALKRHFVEKTLRIFRKNTEEKPRDQVEEKEAVK